MSAQPETSQSRTPQGKTPQSPSTKQDWQVVDSYKTPLDICWNFDYAIDIDKLRNLYTKSKRLQWNSDVDLTWDVELDPSSPIVDQTTFAFDKLDIFEKLSKSQVEAFTAHSTCQLLSQFLHGEQGALMTASVLTHSVPDYEAKLYCATQTMDEARHVEVYEKYIEKLAIVYPISPWLKEIIDATLQADHWVKVAIGMNMVIEGLALGAFHNMRRSTTCDLLRSLTENVLRDEARHVAFGNVYVSETLRAMHPDDREDVAEFAFGAIKSMVDSQGGVDGRGQRRADPGFLRVLEAVGIELEDFRQSMIRAGAAGVTAEAAPGQVHSFKDLMMPALVRVGAVTERSRKLFEQAGIPVWDDASVLESMEDTDTGTIEFQAAEVAREFEAQA